MNEINLILDSVDVTPETADKIACDLVAKHGPTYLKHRYTMNIFMPPYACVPSELKEGQICQRHKIMSGEQTKLFFICITGESSNG